MPHSVATLNFFHNLILLVDRRTKMTSLLELVRPAWILTFNEIIEHLSSRIVFSLLLCIIKWLNVDDALVFLAKLETIWLHVGKLNGE